MVAARLAAPAAARRMRAGRHARPHTCRLSGGRAGKAARARNDGNEGPSLRGGEAAEAIQAGGAARDGREAYRVAMPFLDCFARARNDGEQLSLALAMTGRRFHRHCEAAKPPKQSRPAVPHGMGGRRTVLQCRFWIASPALRAGSQ